MATSIDKLAELYAKKLEKIEELEKENADLRRELKTPIDLDTGMAHFQDGEYGTTVRIFPENATEEEIRAEYDYPDGDHCKHSHDCCGRWYPGQIEIVKARGSQIVLQHWSMNV
jgi:hypothetical protein